MLIYQLKLVLKNSCHLAGLPYIREMLENFDSMGVWQPCII